MSGTKATLQWESGLDYAEHRTSALAAPASAFAIANGVVVADREREQVVFLTRDLTRVRTALDIPALRWASPLADGHIAIACRHELRIVRENGSPVARIPCPVRPDFVGQGRNGRLVVVDSTSGRCVELNDAGDVVWATPSSLALRQPRSAVLYNDREYLIVDDAANWVILFSPESDTIRWQFGVRGKSDRCPTSLFSPKYAAASTHGVLIADSYNNRVFEVDERGSVVWQYGVAAEPGSTPGHLWRPCCATETADHTILIADSKNDRVIEVGRDGRQRGSFGTPVVSRCALRLPRSIAPCDDGTFVVANTHADEIAWLAPRGQILRSWPNAEGELYWPRSAVPDGERLLVCDGRNDRIVEVTDRGGILECQPWLESTVGCEIRDPHNLSASREGWLLASTGNDRVYRLSRDGSAVSIVLPGISLCDPHFAIETSDGSLIVADTGNSRLVIEDAAGQVTSLESFSRSTGGVPLIGPRFVSELPDRRLLVIDTMARSIMCADRAGRLHWSLDSVEDVDSGGRPFYVDGPSFCYEPRWVTHLGGGQLVIGDTGNNRILSIRVAPNVWRGQQDQAQEG